jgi:hypothetical protein
MHLQKHFRPKGTHQAHDSSHCAPISPNPVTRNISHICYRVVTEFDILPANFNRFYEPNDNFSASNQKYHLEGWRSCKLYTNVLLPHRQEHPVSIKEKQHLKMFGY